MAPGRPLLIVGGLVILLIFYLTGPFSATTSKDAKLTSNADARLARWLEAVAGPSHAFDLPHKPPHFEKAKPLVPFSPYPLGMPASPRVARRSSQAPTAEFADVVFDFQRELEDLTPLKVDIRLYKDYKPRNYRSGPARPTFATFLSTRNGSLLDPYFAATQSLVYQMLWSPVVSSREYPFTVFVAPFVAQEQRDILSGAGAVVRELDLLPWQPNVEGVHARFKDQFSKLNMWGKTEFSRIAFMDSDAFPIRNIDEIFEIAERQRCEADQLSGDDAQAVSELCNYVFAGVENIGSKGEINGGFLVFEPNERMHQRLLRNYQKTGYYDNLAVDQGFFGWQFAQTSAFPARLLPRKYNGYFPQAADEGRLSIVHDKTWALGKEDAAWLKDLWFPTWREMLDFYNSRAFARDRSDDGVVAKETGDSFGRIPGAQHEMPARGGSPPTRDGLRGERDNDHARLQKGQNIDDSIARKQQKILERTQQNRMVREDN